MMHFSMRQVVEGNKKLNDISALGAVSGKLLGV
jgi:hypothetical protein